MNLQLNDLSSKFQLIDRHGISSPNDKHITPQNNAYLQKQPFQLNY